MLKLDIRFENCTAVLKLQCNDNKNVIILLPGQTMPAQMFFDINMFPDGSTIADKISESGFDVAYLDPVGYGESSGQLNRLYTKQAMATQLIAAVKMLKSMGYEKIVCHGYCNTSHIPLIAATQCKLINGVVLQSPVLHEGDEQFSKEYIENRHPDNYWFYNDIENLLENRLKTVNDIGRGYSMRPDNWEESIKDGLAKFPSFEKTRWRAAKDMTVNIRLHYSMYQNHGWDISKVSVPISVIRGEFDVECERFLYNKFLTLIKPNLVSEIRVKNSSHFGFWDSNVDIWANDFIKSIHAL